MRHRTVQQEAIDMIQEREQLEREEAHPPATQPLPAAEISRRQMESYRTGLPFAAIPPKTQPKQWSRMTPRTFTPRIAPPPLPPMKRPFPEASIVAMLKRQTAARRLAREQAATSLTRLPSKQSS